MESVKKLEDKIEQILKPVPHLPVTWRKWLGENIWWITLIGAIISGIVVLISLLAILVATAAIGTTSFILGSSYYQGYGGTSLLAMIAAFAFMVATAVLSIRAIQPLKNRNKYGWDLLFLSAIIGVTSSVVVTILDLDFIQLIPKLINAAVSAAISAYLLFEIRSQFNAAKVLSKK